MAAILADKYRPSRLDDVIGQPKAVALVQRVLSRGVGGRAIFIDGPTGTGKTTLAKIIAGTLADPFYVRELVGRDLNPATIRELDASLRLYSMGKGGRAVIVNEVHGIGRAALEVLLDVLEPGNIPGHACWIFTTTWDGSDQLFADCHDFPAFHSRCIRVSLTNQGLAEPFAKRALEIARAEGLDGRPLAEYVKLARECKNNFRAMLTQIDAGAMLA